MYYYYFNIKMHLLLLLLSKMIADWTKIEKMVSM